VFEFEKVEFLEGCGFSMNWRNLVSWTEKKKKMKGAFPHPRSATQEFWFPFAGFPFAGFLAGFPLVFEGYGFSPQKGTSLVLCFVLFSFPFAKFFAILGLPPSWWLIFRFVFLFTTPVRFFELLTKIAFLIGN